MDEHVLNDLLECAVCLERLQPTSKVLPCQHTFCRHCLEDILQSQGGLRCPECRVLYTGAIDDLPPNVLLMRILEGLKTYAFTKRPQSGNINKAEEEPIPADVNGRRSQQHKQQQRGQPQQEEQQQEAQHYWQQEKRSAATSTLNSSGPTSTKTSSAPSDLSITRVPRAYAKYDYATSVPTDLKFKKDSLILLKGIVDENWLVGQCNGQEGAFPVNYVKIILPLPSAIALFDFEMAPNEAEGCLIFKKHTVIHVLRRVDYLWAEGCIGTTKIGIFPITYVKLNEIARELLNGPQPPIVCDAEASASTTFYPPRALPSLPSTDRTSSYTNTTNPSSSDASSAISTPEASPNRSLPHTPQHVAASADYPSSSSSVRYRDGREKRHSLNALFSRRDISGTNSSTTQVLGVMRQSNRHSAEILSVPHDFEVSSISGSATTTNTSPSTSYTVQPKEATATNEYSAHLRATQKQQQQAASQSHTRANVLRMYGGVQQNLAPLLPWSYVALYPYKPRKSDELELKKGCYYVVTEHCQDGWFKGKDWQNKCGVFPGNYVSPLRQRDQQQLMLPHANLQVCVREPPDLPRRQVTCNNKKPTVPHTITSTAAATSGPVSNPSIYDWLDNIQSAQPRPSPSYSATLSSASSAAVNLVKRFKGKQSSQKSSSKPSTEITTVKTIDNQTFEKMSPVPSVMHVRSGSCPSQLLETAPVSVLNGENTFNQQNHKMQVQSTYGYGGSQRIRGNKERPELLSARRALISWGRNTDIIDLPKCAQQQQHQPQHINICEHKKLNIHNSPSHQSLINNRSDSNKLPTATAINAAQIPSSNLTTAAIKASATTKSAQNTPERRYRCIVPYPPNSDIELELHIGDIVYVQRKQKNGWYKGTHAATNKTGLFPASFVEPDI